MVQRINIGQHTVWIKQLAADKVDATLYREELLSFVQKKVDLSITQISHDRRGKPYLPELPNYSISISHTGSWIAFGISKYGDIGIDLELENPKIKSASSLFLNAYEQSIFPHATVPDLHLIWGAKEAVYKCFGGTIESLQKDITITSINQDQKQIHVTAYDQPVCCNYRIISEKYYLVVCATAAPTQ